METLGLWTETSWSELTFSLEDSLARISVAPENAPASADPKADYGQNTHGSFGRFDPGTYLLRTCQLSLLTDQCGEYSGTWPRAGTMRNGRLYAQKTLVFPIAASAYLLWPTPTAGDAPRYWFSKEQLLKG